MLHRPLAAALSSRLHYAWVVLGVMFLATICSMGVRATPGVIIVPLHQAFGWSISAISGAVSVNIILLGLLAPFMAGLMQSIGLKRTVLGAMCLLCAGTLLSMFIRETWQLYLTWGFMVGIGASAGSIGLATAVVNRWFAIHKATAVGIMSSANAAGQLIFLPFLGMMADRFGWQAVALTVSVAMAGVVVLLFLFLPESPARIGLPLLGATEVTEPRIAPGQNPFALTLGALNRAVRKLDFWLLSVSFAACGFSTNGLIGTHLISYCADNGIPQLAASSMLASLGLFSMIGSASSGWITDRVNPRFVLFTVYTLRGLSLVVLPFSDFSSTSMLIFAVFYGLDWSASGPPTYALSNELFGERDAPMIVAWIYTAHQVGGSLAALLAGTVRDVTGSYMVAFMASGLTCMTAAIMVLRIRRQPALAAAE